MISLEDADFEENKSVSSSHYDNKMAKKDLISPKSTKATSEFKADVECVETNNSKLVVDKGLIILC